MGEINGTDATGVKVLEIVDNDENIKKAQEPAKVEIKAADEKVWATDTVHVRESYTPRIPTCWAIWRPAMRSPVPALCDNGWSRVDYNGKDAFVYSQYLTTTQPESPSAPAPAKPSAKPVTARAAKRPADAKADPGHQHLTRRRHPRQNRRQHRRRNPLLSPHLLRLQTQRPSRHHEPTPEPEVKTLTGYVVSYADGELVVFANGADYPLNVTDAQHSYVSGILTGNEVTVTYTGDLQAYESVVVLSVSDSELNAGDRSVITGVIASALHEHPGSDHRRQHRDHV